MTTLLPYQQSLSAHETAHLLRRATMGTSKSYIHQCTGKTAEALINEVFTLPDPTPSPIDPATGLSWTDTPLTEQNSEDDKLKQYVMYWWFGTTINRPANIRDKMVWFFHSHFTTMQSRVRYSKALYHQIKLFEYFALGNFKTLSKKICLDTAMLFHLDGHLNEDGRPNENYAREFLELYTIGKGPQIGDGDYTYYTEQDVREAARVLSGYVIDKEFEHIDEETGIPSGYIRSNGTVASRHDAGQKTFSDKFVNQTIAPVELQNGKATVTAAMDELDQLVEMIFAQKDTARHIARKLYRFFVYYQITDEVQQQIIEPLAQMLLDEDYELEPVLKALLTSQHFYDADNSISTDDIIGSQIKSPLELMTGTLKYFDVQLPDPFDNTEAFYEQASTLLSSLSLQGLSFYEPPEVAGYSAYHQAPAYNRNWITPNNLARRYEFAAHFIANNSEALGLEFPLMNYINTPENVSNPEVAQDLADTFIDSLLPRIITQERREYLSVTIFLDEFQQQDWIAAWINYQNSGDDTIVKGLIEKFLVALMQTPEYQLA